MRLTNEQQKERKNCLLKAHYWFCEDWDLIFKDFDYFIDEENTLFYVFSRGDSK